MKLLRMAGLSLAGALLFAQPAFAHVTVKPGEVLTGSYETFTVSVPNEEDTAAVTELRLVMPEGLEGVTPSVTPGWEVSVDEEGQGEDAAVTSITWQGGEIPAGFRDDFTFSAKTPDEAGELRWKAYQTYDNGTVVAWAFAEGEEPETPGEDAAFTEAGPFSVTSVVAEAHDHSAGHGGQSRLNLMSAFIATGALFVALAAFAIATRKPQATPSKKGK